jgi:hypothetical protein
MPPIPGNPLTNSRSFDRIEGESPQAYEAFCTYRNMGAGRSIEKLRQSLGRPEGDRMLYKWSSDWNWVARVKYFDEMIEQKAREIAESYIPMWEQRRQVALERMMLFSAKLMSKAEAMLEWPIEKEVTRESEDGRTVYHIVEPAKWNFGSLATMIKTAFDVQTAAISEGLILSDEDSFDVETASPDELRAFINRSKRRITSGA